MTSPVRTADVADPAVDARARLRAAPPLEPPYDDDTPAPLMLAVPQLRVVPGLSCPEELPFDLSRRGLRLAGRRTNEEDDPLFGPQLTPRTALTDPAHHASRILRAVLEILARRRPLHQLLPWTSEDVYEELTAWMYRTAQRHGPPATVRSVHVSEPADGIAEVSAVVSQECRVRAVALRLEGVDGRWRCTLLRML